MSQDRKYRTKTDFLSQTAVEAAAEAEVQEEMHKRAKQYCAKQILELSSRVKPVGIQHRDCLVSRNR